jgi:hypothetical protein
MAGERVVNRAIAAALALSISWAPAQAMDFSYRTYKGHVVIDAVGTFEPNDGMKLESFFQTLPPGSIFKLGNAIVFDSNGGNVLEAEIMGGIIEQYHLATGVAARGQCSSACVLAWATGTKKSIAPDGYIGLHNARNNTAGQAPNPERDRLDDLYDTCLMGKWLRKYGAPNSVINQMLDTPASSMYWLSKDDLANWSVRVTP